MKWEYLTLVWRQWDSRPDESGWLVNRQLRKELGPADTDAANVLGLEGWELVCVSESNCYYFKRPLR